MSDINFYPGGVNNSKLVSMSFQEPKANNSRSKFKVEGLPEGKEISVMVPRFELNFDQEIKSDKLHSTKFNEHEFDVKDNSSALIIDIRTEIPVDVELFVKRGSTLLPEPVLLGGANSSNSTISSYSYRYFLSNDALNWSAAGVYFAKLRYKKPNRSLAEELTEVPYNFSVSSYICIYYDEKNETWSTRGVKVINVNCSS